MTDTEKSSANSVWLQAIVGGALTLIPARKYPVWLRQTLTWVPAAGVFGVMAVPGAGASVEEWASGRVDSGRGTADGVADGRVGAKDGDSAPADLGQADERESENGATESHRLARIGTAAAAGALTYGMFRFSFWFDEAAERGLRKLRVPYPRVIMGAAVAAFYVAAEEFDRRYEARAKREQPDER